MEKFTLTEREGERQTGIEGKSEGGRYIRRGRDIGGREKQREEGKEMEEGERGRRRERKWEKEREGKSSCFLLLQ